MAKYTKKPHHQNEENESQAADLVLANKELAHQNEEKEKRAAELVLANKEIAHQKEEKEKRAAELVLANEELVHQNELKEKRAAELVLANKKLAHQNELKKKRAAELVHAHEELVHQNELKEKRAAELILTNEEIFQLRERETLLHEQSVRDLLTGLFNRRYMEDTLVRELNRVARKKLSLAIIMLDIDNFTQFNDNYGHAGGDELLRRLGGCLHEHIRIADIACRYGGDEFVLILPEASREDARECAEQIRQGIKHLRMPFQNPMLVAVTLSIGVAVFPMDGSTQKTVMKAADTALYQAKNAGRDRVIVANQASG